MNTVDNKGRLLSYITEALIDQLPNNNSNGLHVKYNIQIRKLTFS